MKIFITGGTGFIGKHLVKMLKKNHDILLLSRKKMPYALEGNLLEIQKLQSELSKFKPEACIHLAWEGLPNYVDTAINIQNMINSLNIYKLMGEIGCKKIITAGTCWEYAGLTGKVSEEISGKPFNAFSAAKMSLYWLGNEIAKKYNMSFLWTRIFYVYGPGQRSTSLIPYIISQLKIGKAPQIKDPNGKNDFIFVEDVAKAIAILTNISEKSSIYNIGSGYATAIKDIIEIIATQLKQNISYDHSTDMHAPPSTHFYADISHIKKDLGWKPSTSISKGIKQTIESFQ